MKELLCSFHNCVCGQVQQFPIIFHLAFNLKTNFKNQNIKLQHQNSFQLVKDTTLIEEGARTKLPTAHMIQGQYVVEIDGS